MNQNVVFKCSECGYASVLHALLVRHTTRVPRFAQTNSKEKSLPECSGKRIEITSVGSVRPNY